MQNCTARPKLVDCSTRDPTSDTPDVITDSCTIGAEAAFDRGWKGDGWRLGAGSSETVVEVGKVDEAPLVDGILMRVRSHAEVHVNVNITLAYFDGYEWQTAAGQIHVAVPAGLSSDVTIDLDRGHESDRWKITFDVEDGVDGEVIEVVEVGFKGSCFKPPPVQVRISRRSIIIKSAYGRR